jgi:hypothetical protein
MKHSKLTLASFVVSFILLFSVLSHRYPSTELNATVPAVAPLHLTGAENHSISLEEAVDMTTRYRISVPEGSVLAESFGRDAISAILAHPKCAGLKAYYGMKEDGVRVLVLIGVDSEGRDLTNGVIADNGILCPPFCGSAILDNPVF